MNTAHKSESGHHHDSQKSAGLELPPVLLICSCDTPATKAGYHVLFFFSFSTYAFEPLVCSLCFSTLPTILLALPGQLHPIVAST